MFKKNTKKQKNPGHKSENPGLGSVNSDTELLLTPPFLKECLTGMTMVLESGPARNHRTWFSYAGCAKCLHFLHKTTNKINVLVTCVFEEDFEWQGWKAELLGNRPLLIVSSFPPSWSPASFFQCVEFEFQKGLIINSPVINSFVHCYLLLEYTSL